MTALAEKSKKGATAALDAPWPLVRLRDITTKIGSGSTPRGGADVYKESGIPLIRSMNVHFAGFKAVGLAFIDKSEAAKLSNVIVQPDDVLLNITGASIGRVTTAPDSMSGARVNQHVCIIRPKSGLLPQFLAHFFASSEQQSQIMTVQVGATRQALTKAMIENWQIPLPPLTEQRRIVAEIEQQFTRLDAGVAALRRLQANLKRYRAAVLKAACESRLVPTATVWPIKPISAAIDTLDQGWSPKCESEPSNSPETWAVIKTTAIQPLHFLEDENKSLPTALKPRPHLAIQSGDVLITRAGPRTRVGVACAVKTSRPRLMLCDKAYRLRCKHDVATPAFIELVLNAPHIVDELDKLKTGISDSGLNLTQNKFRDLQIPLPTLAEQTRIVAEVERRLSVIDELETAVTVNIQRATRLRQSILRRAYSGQPA